MPTLSDIRDWVREQTLMEEADIATTKLNNIINQGVREVSARFDWPWLASESTISTVAGQANYDLPTDLGRIEVVIDSDDDRRLDQVAPADAWDQYGGDFPDGTPTTFFVWGSKIYLLPVPTKNETDAYTIHYYGSVSTLDNDSSEPAWEDRFHMLLADYAISKVWEREEEPAKAREAEGDFDQAVERMARFYLDRANDTPMIYGAGKPNRRRSLRERTILN